MVEYIVSVLDDNEKLNKCAQLLMWILLVVLSFFIPLLLLHICQWTDLYKRPIPSPSEFKVKQVQNVNILVFTLMENNEYWLLIKDKMSHYYMNELDSMHFVRFAHVDIEYNFDDSFDFREFIKCPEIWNKYDIFNANKTAQIKELCKEYDAVLFIQQYFENEERNNLVSVITDKQMNTLLDGCTYDSIPLIINHKNNGNIELNVLAVDEFVNAKREIVFKFDDDTFYVLTQSVFKLLS